MCASPMRILIMSLTAFILMYIYAAEGSYTVAALNFALGLGLLIFWLVKRWKISCFFGAH